MFLLPAMNLDESLGILPRVAHLTLLVFTHDDLPPFTLVDFSYFSLLLKEKTHLGRSKQSTYENPCLLSQIGKRTLFSLYAERRRNGWEERLMIYRGKADGLLRTKWTVHSE